MNLVYEMLPGVAVSSALLLIAHLALWPYQRAIPRVGAYIIGCGCFVVGMAFHAVMTGDTGPLFVYLSHLIPGGLVVLIAWFVRGLRVAKQGAAADAAMIAEIAERERTY